MKKIGLILICILLIVPAMSAVASAHWSGWYGGRGWYGGPRSSWSVFIAPGPFYYPYPAYAPPPPYGPCEKVCRERVEPVCRYDRWGERWCHDEIVLDCRRICY